MQAKKRTFPCPTPRPHLVRQRITHAKVTAHHNGSQVCLWLCSHASVCAPTWSPMGSHPKCVLAHGAECHESCMWCAGARDVAEGSSKSRILPQRITRPEDGSTLTPLTRSHHPEREHSIRCSFRHQGADPRVEVDSPLRPQRFSLSRWPLWLHPHQPFCLHGYSSVATNSGSIVHLWMQSLLPW